MTRSKCILGHEELLKGGGGSIALEVAVIFFILVGALIGFVSVTEYIRIQTLVSNAVNMVAQVIASADAANSNYTNGDTQEIIKIAKGMSAPNNIRFSIQYCNNGNPVSGGLYTGGMGFCGFQGGANAAVGALPSATCGSTSFGFSRTVSVIAVCYYSPLFNPFGLLNTSITKAVEVPLSYNTYPAATYP